MIAITHYQRLLNYLVPDFVHVLLDGRIVKSGDKEPGCRARGEGLRRDRGAGGVGAMDAAVMPERRALTCANFRAARRRRPAASATCAHARAGALQRARLSDHPARGLEVHQRRAAGAPAVPPGGRLRARPPRRATSRSASPSDAAIGWCSSTAASRRIALLRRHAADRRRRRQPGRRAAQTRPRWSSRTSARYAALRGRRPRRAQHRLHPRRRLRLPAARRGGRGADPLPVRRRRAGRSPPSTTRAT